MNNVCHTPSSQGHPLGLLAEGHSPSEMTDQGNNNQNISCNPFAALFSSLADAKQFASGQKPQQLCAEAPCECV